MRDGRGRLSLKQLGAMEASENMAALCAEVIQADRKARWFLHSAASALTMKEKALAQVRDEVLRMADHPYRRKE